MSTAKIVPTGSGPVTTLPYLLPHGEITVRFFLLASPVATGSAALFLPRAGRCPSSLSACAHADVEQVRSWSR